MSWAMRAIVHLQAGRSVTVRPRGRSMEPLVHDGQEVTLDPINRDNMAGVGDVVLCHVNRRDYLHKVLATSSGKADRWLIGNNRGHVNGWTTSVFGKMRRAV